jgi:hypothetical protein
MVATLQEVGSHAPNDFLAASLKADELCGEVESRKDQAEASQCGTEPLSRYSNEQVGTAEALAAMRERAQRYRSEYRPRPPERSDPSISANAQARLDYLEIFLSLRRSPSKGLSPPTPRLYSPAVFLSNRRWT